MIFRDYQIDDAADILKRGGVIAFPTETVYGLGASVFLTESIKRIFKIKGRPNDNPLIVHISKLKQLSLIAKEIPQMFYHLAEAFFPGPLTILLNRSVSVPDVVCAGLHTVGVRMPNHPLALKLIEAVGAPLVAPSANLSGTPSSTTAQHVIEDFGASIDGVLDGGACQYGIESTVIALSPKPHILRPGLITQQQIENILGHPIPIVDSHTERPLSPGMKYKHYAPKARVLLFFAKSAFEKHLAINISSRRMVVTELVPSELYAILRQADTLHMEEVAIFCDDKTQKDVALMNRITRAAQ